MFEGGVNLFFKTFGDIRFKNKKEQRKISDLGITESELSIEVQHF